MPAPASLSIPGLVDQLDGLELPNPITAAPELRTVLGQVTDPRKPRGVRHGLVVVLTTAVCAVAAGARSFVAIAEWAADLPATVAERLGTDQRCPSEATIRRVVQDVDADPPPQCHPDRTVLPAGRRPPPPQAPPGGPTRRLINWREGSVMPRSYERLHAIAGRWATDGHVVGDPSMPVKGFDTYDVLAGGYFLVHHVDITVGDRPVQAIEISASATPTATAPSLARSTTPEPVK